MNDLHSAFLPRFLDMAYARLARARVAASGGDRDATTTTIRDLHALAGEAGLLGLSTMLPLARKSEDLARKFLAARTDETTAAFTAALDEIGRALEQLATQTGRGS